MAKNCSADVEDVIAHVDKVFTSGNTTAITALKENFGLGAVTHLDDAAGARTSPCHTEDIQNRDILMFQCAITYGSGRTWHRPVAKMLPSSNSAMLWKSRTESVLLRLDGVSIMPLRLGDRIGQVLI